jgi:GNAT superfamily N-acetyltransferase
VGFIVSSWDSSHPRWPELGRVVEDEGQMRWVTGDYIEQFDPHHWLVATDDETDAVVGFLMLIVQPIGPEHDCDPLEQGGETLTQAKIIAFGVCEAYRRRGIGRALQEAAVRRAGELGCYQVRSWSSADHVANHRLKRAMGFAALPERRSDGEQGVYYLWPLRAGLPTLAAE